VVLLVLLVGPLAVAWGAAAAAAAAAVAAAASSSAALAVLQAADLAPALALVNCSVGTLLRRASSVWAFLAALSAFSCCAALPGR